MMPSLKLLISFSLEPAGYLLLVFGGVNVEMLSSILIQMVGLCSLWQFHLSVWTQLSAVAVLAHRKIYTELLQF